MFWSWLLRRSGHTALVRSPLRLGRVRFLVPLSLIFEEQLGEFAPLRMIRGFMLFYELEESLAQSVKVENPKMLAHTVVHARDSQRY
ncbi:hypothetical protein X746_25630 [Mesorhizobium sp. LNJC380A00]|nr:hypothetical protein X746_25630 [Mesorhizobium sp. LNJC380A00]